MKFISLKYKLLYSSIAISILLTVFMSAIEVQYDADKYAKTLGYELVYFERYNREYLASKVWAMEYDSLKAFAENEVSGKWINSLKIVDTRGDIVVEAGEGLNQKSLKRITKLTYFHNDKELVIGKIYYGGSIPGFYETIKARWSNIFLLNGFFIVVIFLLSYILFYRNILARLSGIILFTNKSITKGDQICETNLPNPKNSSDEINLLIDALNNRATRIKNEFTKRLAAESDLEKNNLQLRAEMRERYLLEKELRDGEEKYRNLLESTSTVPWELDIKSGKFTYIGKQIEQILGYSAESWGDINSWIAKIHPEDRDEAAQFYKIEFQKRKDHDLVYRVIPKVPWLEGVGLEHCWWNAKKCWARSANFLDL